MLDLRSATGGRPYVIAHRGASGDAPENTMASFRLAVEQGADLIELDVQLTADGIPVVIHDPTVDRTTDGRGMVHQMALAQIKALNAGARFSGRYGDERILTLDELLDWASRVIPLAIEIKSGPIHYPGIEAMVVDRVRAHDMLDSAVVISFDHLLALRTKELSPDIATGVLFVGAPVKAASLAQAARAEALLPHWSDLTPDMVRQAHDAGLAICPWVVDEEREMGWALAMGVDALATNRPGRLVQMLAGGSRG